MSEDWTTGEINHETPMKVIINADRYVYINMSASTEFIDGHSCAVQSCLIDT